MELKDIYKEYKEATRGLQTSAEEVRGGITEESERQRAMLHGRRGEVERQVQSALGAIRTAERIEQRKKDLPITRPGELMTETQLASIRAQSKGLQS